MNNKLTATILAAYIETDVLDNTTEWIDSVSSCVRRMCFYSARNILDRAAMSTMEQFSKMIISSNMNDGVDDSFDMEKFEEMFRPIKEDFDKHITLENIILEMEKLFPEYERAIYLLRYDYGDDCIDDLENKMGISLKQFYIYCLNTFFDDQSDLLARTFLGKGVAIPNNDIKSLMRQASVITKTVMLKKKIDMDVECKKFAQEFLKDILE